LFIKIVVIFVIFKVVDFIWLSSYLYQPLPEVLGVSGQLPDAIDAVSIHDQVHRSDNLKIRKVDSFQSIKHFYFCLLNVKALYGLFYNY